MKSTYGSVKAQQRTDFGPISVAGTGETVYALPRGGPAAVGALQFRLVGPLSLYSFNAVRAGTPGLLRVLVDLGLHFVTAG